MRTAEASRSDSYEILRHDRCRVLAVDDEPVARQQLVFQIAALGQRVSSAASAREAQEILAQGGSAAFDCLITDLLDIKELARMAA